MTRSRTLRILAAASLSALAASWLACATTPEPPDFRSLYNRAARHHDEHRNPVIVIPGILGSKLVDSSSGRTVWGAFGGDAVDPRGAADARLFALPMEPGRALSGLQDAVRPAGVLESLQIKLAGLPIELKAYTQILLTLGAGGYRDEQVHLENIDYGSDHYTCFQFDYDWRRDNVENARRLAAFLREKKAYVSEQITRRHGVAEPEVKFDVIAHSMGGLVLRYFLRYGDAELPADGTLPEPTWAGAADIERAVLVGTPNAGSADALVQLVNGRKFGPTLPMYQPAVVGSFPSLYQLLPRPRHRVLEESGEIVDFMDPEQWRQRGWGLMANAQAPVLEALLPESSASRRMELAFDHLEKSLARARRFHAALDVPASPPPGTSLHLVAGDAEPTAAALTYRGGQMVVRAERPGDGTVLRSSALMDERLGGDWQPTLKSPIDWSQVTFLFTNHLGLTKDPAFTDNVLYLLLEAPR